MGYNVEHAIVVTSWDNKLLAKAHKKANEIFPEVSERVPHITNGGASFLVPPDGSKEGWEESDAGDVRRPEAHANGRFFLHVDLAEHNVGEVFLC